MNRNLIKYIFAVISIFYTVNSAQAANIVYPKSQNTVINAPRTFFIGNEVANKTLTINDEKVEIHPSGGFYHVVALREGENTFKINNGSSIKKYTITRNSSAVSPKKDKFITYNAPITAFTSENNVPIRSIPNENGLNRLQHLEKDIPLSIVGEYGNFYKVQLCRDDYVWIAKSHVKKIPEYTNSLSEIQSYNYIEDNKNRVFEIKLSKKVPYILTESDGFDLVLYGIKNLPYNKYEFHINKSGKNFGYTSFYKSDNTLTIKIKKYPTIDSSRPLKDLTVVVDAGHGGNEFGAIGCLGHKEKEINLHIAMKIKSLLENAGANVIMTRQKDESLSLKDRVDITNNNNADLFISIHNNALPDSSAHLKTSGTEVYYFYPQSKAFAKSVLESITKETGMKNNKARAESFAVIRNTNCPAILVEIGYMINPEDNAKLIDPEFQNKAAKSILHGLEKYLNEL
ncbi:N-acetylmuramoyl-L-alanine amidase [bacterium]|nr:N-acetylmuramoyl-L-alanine amidase [bacterium]